MLCGLFLEKLSSVEHLRKDSHRKQILKKKQLFNYFHLKGQAFNDLENDQNLPLPKDLHTCVIRDCLEAKFPFF